MFASLLTDTMRGLARPIIAQASSSSLTNSLDRYCIRGRDRLVGRRCAFAQKERGERALLVHLDSALAHELERRRKARGEHRRALRRLDHVGDQEVVERAPI